MALTKLLLLAFGPPFINWLIGRFWFRYRELRLNKFVFVAWLVMFLPAVVLVVNGVAQAVDIAQAQAGTHVAVVPAAFTGEQAPAGKAAAITAVANSFDWIRQQYPLRGSHYDPALGGTNCDHDCSVMASGDSTFSWAGGKDGVYASACANRPDLGWVIGSASKGTAGTRFTAGGKIYECRDTGGWIKCHKPGDYDPAIANAHAKGYLLDLPVIAEIDYCWVDLYDDPLVSYGHLIVDWQFGELAVDTAVAQASGPLTMETAVSLLYMGSERTMSQGWHSSVGLPDAQDWTAGCRTPLFSPVPGVAKVTHNGDDGLSIGNTMITIEGPGGKVTLLHGNYDVLVGSTVVGGVTRIGSEASNGDSTDCHSHVILYNQ